MARFRIWLESNLRREQQAKVQQIYDMAVRQLLGSARDQTHLSLSEIEDDGGGPGQPPSNKGALVAFKKLQKAQIFEKLKQLGDPELASKAADAENYLQKAANDQVVGPKDTVGQLLNKMFGDDAVEIYGDRSWETMPHAKTHQPDDNPQPGNNAVTPPMSTEQPPGVAPPMGGPPPMDPSMMGGMPPQPGAPPMGAAPPMDPSMMGGPPMPQMPIQSQGGPMPPKPPGGLAMA